MREDQFTNLIKTLTTLAQANGWHLLLLNAENEEVDGLVIGTPEFIKKLSDMVEENDRK